MGDEALKPRPMKLKFTQIEMVEMQIDRACRLFYVDGDTVSALALVSRAVDVLNDLLPKMGVKPKGFHQLIKALPAKERAKKWKEMREAEVAGKHYLQNQRKLITVNPQAIEFVIFNGVYMLNCVGRPLPPAVEAVKGFMMPRLFASFAERFSARERAEAEAFMAKHGVKLREWDLPRFRVYMATLQPSYSWAGVAREIAAGVGR